MHPSRPSVDVRRSSDRYRTRTAWLDTRHSFAAGRHYDPRNTSFGRLLLHDEHGVAPGAGFAQHRHRGVEVVTWVLEGALRHEDSTGRGGLVLPGQVQRMSAGSGVLHTERNDSVDEPLRFVQAWLTPDDDAVPPSVAQADVEQELRGGGLVAVVSGTARGESAVRLGARDAALHVARPQAGQGVQLPDAPWLHVFVARGDVELEQAGRLSPGDAVRITAAGGMRLRATSPAEVLVWEMGAGPVR